MKLTQEALNKVFDGITFEAHERVPFFVVDKDSYLDMTESIDIDGETIQVQVPIIGNYYTEELDGVTYAKMNSTHKNADGTFSGAEPTYSSEQPALEEWQEAFGLAYSAEDMKEIRRVAAMTPEEYRDHARVELEAQSKPGHFAFECEIDGNVYQYDIDDSDRIDVIGQLVMGATEVEIHDVSRSHPDPYTAEEAGLIMGTLAAVTRTHKYPIDAKIKALAELPEGFTVEDVDAAVNG